MLTTTDQKGKGAGGGPSAECKGLVFWPIPEFSDSEVAFGAAASRYFNRHDLPDVPREFEDKANDLFFKGGKVQGLAPQVDSGKAYRALRAWLASFAPSHESKETTVGYALWLWSTPAALSEQQS